MPAELLELPSATLEDVPTVLRSIADNIESGEYGRAVNAVVVLESDDDGMRIEVFASGSFNEVRITIGLLSMAQSQLAARCMHERAGT